MTSIRTLLRYASRGRSVDLVAVGHCDGFYRDEVGTTRQDVAGREGGLTGQSGTTAGELIARARRELVETAEPIRSHRFLERLRSREVAGERLRALAGAQHATVSSDRRSFAVLAARFPSGLAGAFFLGMAEGEGVALDKLRGLADWLGMTDEELRAHEPHPGAQAYPAFVAWLALNGSRADVVLAFSRTSPSGGRTAARSRPRCARPTGRGTTRSRSSTFFARPAEDFEARALEVLGEGLAAAIHLRSLAAR